MKRVALALAALVAVLAALSLLAGELLTRPVRQAIGAPPPGLVAEGVLLADGQGRAVAGWFLPGRAGRGGVLLLHGVRGNRLQMLARARWLQREGIASLLIDLPSHGESSGERIGFGRLEAPAVDAALAWLRQRLPGERIGAIGVSLGGASLLFAQRRPELDALVLESVYPTLEDAVQDRLAMRLGASAGRLLAPALLVQVPLRLGFDTDRLRPIDAITDVRAPLWVAAGTADRHTRWPETEALFAAAPEPKRLWPVAGAAHVDLHAFDGPAYEAALGPWLQARLRKPPG
jgi:dienelactone hydrolase